MLMIQDESENPDSTPASADISSSTGSSIENSVVATNNAGVSYVIVLASCTVLLQCITIYSRKAFAAPLKLLLLKCKQKCRSLNGTPTGS